MGIRLFSALADTNLSAFIWSVADLLRGDYKQNDLFTGELSDEDKVMYVGTVIRSKLLESKTLQQQASSNSKEQFSSSPDLVRAQQDAIIDALDAHQSMSSQALNNPDLQKRMLELLLGNFNLWEGLREKAVEETVGS